MTTATVVRERPILFSDAMVSAILAGKKTQTRRVVRRQPAPTHPNHWIHGAEYVPECDRWLWEERWESYDKKGRGSDYLSPDFGCNYGAIGDKLWVREAHAILDMRPEIQDHELAPRPIAPWPVSVTYRADDSERRLVRPPEDWRESYDADHVIWRPTTHMPRWASRITLEVTSVRVERVQDISEDDAKSEGISTSVVDPSPHGIAPIFPKQYVQAREVFRDMWDSINEKRGYGWAANPCVWAISFRVLEVWHG